MMQTLDQIRTQGLAALRRELGPAGFIRFMQQFETGHGDYVRERREWVKRTTMADIRAAVAKRKKSKKK
jgi:hypothetical protein